MLSPITALNFVLNRFEQTFLPNRLLSKPTYAQIESTNKCNLKCVMCAHGNPKARSSLNSKNLSLVEFKHILDHILSVVSISLQGSGEPLLNPELFDMIKYARARGKRVYLVTNATLLSDVNINKILESGLSTLAFSIDAVDKKTFEKIRVGSNFDDVVGNIQRFMDVKEEGGSSLPDVWVRAVITKDNIHEVPAIMKLADELGIKNLRLSAVQTLEVAKLDGMKTNYSAFKELGQYKSLADDMGLNIEFLPSLDPRSANVPCHWPWEAVYITSKGYITPCCGIPSPEFFCFGNIFKEDFNRIWNNSSYKNFRAMAKSNPPKFCIECPFS